MNKTITQKRPFGGRDKVGYMLGHVANDFTFIFASLYLQVFYTDVLGINAGIVGTMFLISRIVDAFTDTAMGRICDKTKATQNGKFRPWLLRACGPVALASFLMYQTFTVNSPMTVRIIYMFVTYLLWGSICYTAINIPYGSMASVMSNEPDDRAALSTFRGVGSMIPQILVGVVVPMFLYTTLEDGTKVEVITAENFGTYFQEKPAKVLMIMQHMSQRIRGLTKDYLEACQAINENVENENISEEKRGRMKSVLKKLFDVYPDEYRKMAQHWTIPQ